ncbi:hypothetical protein SLEP1_g44851 [Rubroshorea leprosula]|uniref:Uncharacterized protein n=1 Tax=Rubroshorea leprosula TaxID=152421 RepID=A0AAV5LJ70_9ROSI|nr:hypothetical protein SLEP1_g44851 [Rubroshorea leprosula]
MKSIEGTQSEKWKVEESSPREPASFSNLPLAPTPLLRPPTASALACCTEPARLRPCFLHFAPAPLRPLCLLHPTDAPLTAGALACCTEPAHLRPCFLHFAPAPLHCCAPCACCTLLPHLLLAVLCCCGPASALLRPTPATRSVPTLSLQEPCTKDK